MSNIKINIKSYSRKYTAKNIIIKNNLIRSVFTFENLLFWNEVEFNVLRWCLSAFLYTAHLQFAGSIFSNQWISDSIYRNYFLFKLKLTKNRPGWITIFWVLYSAFHEICWWIIIIMLRAAIKRNCLPISKIVKSTFNTASPHILGEGVFLIEPNRSKEAGGNRRTQRKPAKVSMDWETICTHNP